MAAEDYTLADMKNDAKRAFDNADRFHGELRDIWKYFSPFRQPTNERAQQVSGKAVGAKRTNELYDGTGPSAQFAFVSHMKAEWMPAFEPFCKVENGLLYKASERDKEKLNARAEQLQGLTDVIHGLTMKIRATSTDEMFHDYFAGTGSMILTKGPKNDPIRGFATPAAEIALESGAFGMPDRRFWRRKWPVRHIPQLFPKATISDDLNRLLKEDRNLEVEVTQYSYWDARGENENDHSWRFCVYTDRCEGKPLWHPRMRSSRWLTPRMFVVPGESMGRGLAHIGLPFVKTVNKARELALRAAAFALLGLWTRRHDGVFNPDTAAMIPGAMWKVASNGSGGFGPTIQRLDVAKDFNISTVVINDEREQIRRVLLDDELPEISDRVRSPTEIAGRMRRYDRNRGGATTRFAYEGVYPFVEGCVDILAEHNLLPSGLQLDDIITQAVVTAPAAAAQRTDRVERMVSAVQIAIGLVGPQAAQLIYAIEDIIPQIARDLGVDEKFIRKKTEVDLLKQLIDQAVRAALEQQKAAKDAPPVEQPEVAPEQAYMNGGF
jgi:hypothetical protein